MLETGAHYLRIVGPSYEFFFGLGIVLYFASQGAGKLLWPVIGNIVRLAVALGGGWLAIRYFNSLAGVFVAQAVALVIYGSLNAWAIAGGAWLGGLPGHAPQADCSQGLNQNWAKFGRNLAGIWPRFGAT